MDDCEPMKFGANEENRRDITFFVMDDGLGLVAVC